MRADLLHSLVLENVEAESLVELVHFAPVLSHFGGVGVRSTCNFRAF